MRERELSQVHGSQSVLLHHPANKHCRCLQGNAGACLSAELTELTEHVAWVIGSSNLCCDWGANACVSGALRV
jgi:hypothetical protein